MALILLLSKADNCIVPFRKTCVHPYCVFSELFEVEYNIYKRNMYSLYFGNTQNLYGRKYKALGAQKVTPYLYLKHS